MSINRKSTARDADNRLIGYDFWDMDDRPYDAHPVNSEFFVQRHGTRSASILLREAPAIELVPYRYPRPDMSRMQAQFTGEAFGIANTRMRPWLTNSVWMMLDVDDPGIALAHELYHVLANSGAHVDGGANLMQGRTRPDSTMLTPAQCQLARDTGISHGLLRD
ncbi:MAG: hypothetical protein GY802_29195 [Gammaproteobacteria bacterium]|nr:hypothetical protein [Gammaproteobacteria bacterium]